MASRYTNNGLELFANGEIDWVDDDIRCLLTTSSFSPNQDTLDFVDDVTNELSGGNYVRKSLTTTTVQDDANDRAELGATNVTWTALGAAAGTPARAIIFKFVSTDADSPVLGWVDLTTPPAPNGGDYTVKWNNGATDGTIFRNAAA